MSSKKVQIADEVEFNNVLHEQTIATWERTLIPLVEGVALEYSALGMGTFDNDVYLSVMNSGIDQIKKRYTEHVESEIKKAGISLLAKLAMDQIPERLAPLNKSTTALIEGVRSVTRYGYLLQIMAEDILIVKGKPVLQEEQIRKRYCTYLETNTEREVWEIQLEIEKLSEKLAHRLKSANYPVNQMRIYSDNTNDGFFVKI